MCVAFLICLKQYVTMPRSIPRKPYDFPLLSRFGGSGILVYSVLMYCHCDFGPDGLP